MVLTFPFRSGTVLPTAFFLFSLGDTSFAIA